MLTRILTAVLGIPLMLVLLFWPGGKPWFFGVAVVMVIAGWEYVTELRKKDIWVHWITMAFFSVYLLMISDRLNYLGHSETFHLAVLSLTRNMVWITVLLVLLTLAADLFWKHRAPVKNFGATLFGIAYIGLLFPHLVALRGGASLGAVPSFTGRPYWIPPGDPGAWIMLAVLLIIWSADSAAYFTGRKFGKHKCAPEISPNKTWEGIYGGLIAAAVAGFIGFIPWLGWSPLSLVLGLVIGVAGMIGDLVESAIKREMGVKDFGSLLPGHGGILDRFDSLLFATPVAFWLIFLFGLKLL